MISKTETTSEALKKSSKLKKLAFPVISVVAIASAFTGGVYFANKDSVTAPFDEFLKKGTLEVGQTTLEKRPTLKEILEATPVSGYQDGEERCGLLFTEKNIASQNKKKGERKTPNRGSISFSIPQLVSSFRCDQLDELMQRGAEKYYGIAPQ